MDESGLELDVLRTRLRDLSAKRRSEERVAAQRRTLELAVRLCERDLQARTSPALNEARDRADRLRLRLATSRTRADHIIEMLEDLFAPERASSPTANQASDADDSNWIAGMTEVRRMRAMLDEHMAIRRTTDLIGIDG